MFLLIHGRKHIPLHESYQFTFHNVSINTETRKQKLRRCYSHLHSTMFLLIQTVRFFPMCHLKRFTFHNVSINTMALYNNPYQYSLFTFHNVSINTYAVNNGMLTGFKFTFHNVSINTAGAVGNVDYGKNLHSTMFLLIRDTNAWHSDSEFRFTFHNVSINTAERKCRSA